MNPSRSLLAAVAVSISLAGPGLAQFTGPSQGGEAVTVEAAQDVGFGTYVVLEGTIVAHLREDYYTFRDATGEIMVEIASDRFGGREVGPDTRVSLMGEVDRRSAGQRYVWVKSLTIL